MKRHFRTPRNFVLLAVMFAISLTAALALWLGYHWFRSGKLATNAIRPPGCAEILDERGDVLDYACTFDGVRLWRPLSDFPPRLKELVVMLEDDKFYEHGGLDLDQIKKSVEVDLERKKLARGASTITQQLAKNLFLTREKTFLRKASEVPLAMRLEKEFSKDQILELYLNTIEWGPGVFGAEAASRLYFDHPAEAMRDEEAWLLALIIPNPKALNPWVNVKSLKALFLRASQLSERLWREHHMERDEAEQALARFHDFVEGWAVVPADPFNPDRHYPVRWQLNARFSLSDLSSVRKAASLALRHDPQAKLRTHVDRRIQLELARAADPLVRFNETGQVALFIQEGKLRGIAPVTRNSPPESFSAIAETNELELRNAATRSLPFQMLWARELPVH